MSNYAENICVAIDQIVTAKLEGLAYDITKLCTIIDDTDKNNGKYIVSDGSVKFEAYSTDKNLREGNSVLVTVPNGDFNMQKTIIGKQTAINTQPFAYTPPLSTMISIENNKYETINSSLLANNPNEKLKLIDTIEGKEKFVGFTRLGVSADFKAWLSGYDTMSGSYGLKMLVYADMPDTINSNNQAKTAVYELTLSNMDMYGNPYNFETFFNQEKVFDISNINKINKIEVYFFQGEDFLNGSNEKIPYCEEKLIEDQEEEFLFSDNLFINNFELFLGYDQDSFKEDTLLLYTYSSMTYDNKIDAETLKEKKSNKKEVFLRWIHKKDDGRFYLLTEESLKENPDFSVKWYRYKLGASAPDEYAGVNWEQVRSHPTNQLSYIFNPDVTKATEEIKAIGFIEGINISQQVFRSNLLVFTNEHEIVNTPTVEITEALSLYFEDESDGNYFIYNQNGKLIDSSQGSGHKRIVRVLYKGAELDKSLGVQEITWYIPGNNSMIKLDDNVYKSNKIEDGKVKPIYDYKYKSYYQITRTVDPNTNPETKQDYFIYDFWSPSYANNTIACYVKINDVVYEVYQELGFGKAGTNGSNVTLVVNFENGKNCLNLASYSYKISNDNQNISFIKLTEKTTNTADDKYLALQDENNSLITIKEEDVDSTVVISANLYDASGKDLNLEQILKDNPDVSLTWDWKDKSNELNFITTPTSGVDSFKTKTKISLTGDSIEDIKNKLKENYYILKVSLSGYQFTPEGKPQTLVSYLPIPIKTNTSYNYIVGAKEVIYDHQGNPNYYKGPYKLYMDNAEKNEKCSWGINCTSIGNKPTLKNVENGVGLSAAPFYIKNEKGEKDYNQVCVYAYNNNTKEVYWSQPVLIMQSQYDFSMLNEWDGTLTIDEKNGTILSTMLGAGKKDEENRFSGVLIGDVGGGTDLNSTTSLTGVYGLHQGVFSYGLKEDGTAFFGKAGSGQILIDGNKSTIQSRSYEDKDFPAGMKMDLDNGILEIKNRNGYYYQPVTSGEVNENNFTEYFIYNSESKEYVQAAGKFNSAIIYYEKKQSDSYLRLASSEPYFEVTDIANNELISIGSKDYYLQSSDYSYSNGVIGSKLDLNDGTFISKSIEGSILLSPKDPFFIVKSRDDKTLINMGTEGYYLQSSGYIGKSQVQGSGYVLNDNNSYDYIGKYYLYKGNHPTKSSIETVTLANVNGVFYTRGSAHGDGYILTRYSFPSDVEYTYKTVIDNIEVERKGTYTPNDIKFIYMSNMKPVYENNEIPTGLKIDLNTGIIHGYDLYLKGEKSEENEQYFILDSSAPVNPFQIGTKFKVDWDGRLYCDSITYVGNKPKKDDQVININDQFIVNSSGGGSAPGFSCGYAGGAGSAASAATVTSIGGPLESEQLLLLTARSAGNGFEICWAWAIEEIINKAVEQAQIWVGRQGYLKTLPYHNHGLSSVLAKGNTDLSTGVVTISGSTNYAGTNTE